MPILKCKMCGGELNVSEDQTVCECEYCGTKQTLPRIDNDRKLNLYDRANHYRRNNDYDKAISIYEQILNEDLPDSEAYWSLVLCRYGIEYVEDAIADAKVNAQMNNLTNLDFYAGDMKNVLTDSFIAEHGRPDVIITDPPRSGMHPDVVQVILNANPKRIVYVSCNPATQARDLAMMSQQYRIAQVQPVDMFPQTQHVENVVQLIKIE